MTKRFLSHRIIQGSEYELFFHKPSLYIWVGLKKAKQLLRDFLSTGVAWMGKIDPNDSIQSIVERLAKYGGSGTDCSLPMLATTNFQPPEIAVHSANVSARTKMEAGIRSIEKILARRSR